MTHHFVTAGSWLGQCQPIQAWSFLCLFPPLPNIWKLVSWLINIFISSMTTSLFPLTNWSFARHRQNTSVNYTKSLFYAAMGETLGDSPVDPEHGAFADALPVSTSQGKVHSWCCCRGCFGRSCVGEISCLFSTCALQYFSPLITSMAVTCQCIQNLNIEP